MPRSFRFSCVVTFAFALAIVTSLCAGCASLQGEGGSVGTGGSSAISSGADFATSPVTAAGEQTASVTVIGQSADGTMEVWAEQTYVDIADAPTAADATLQVFDSVGLSAEHQDSDYGFYLVSITSPNDEDLNLAYDEDSGRFWQLYLNGESSDVGASSIELSPGDEVVWYYSAYGDALPEGLDAAA